MSTTASDVNESTRAKREAAAKGNQSAVDLEAQRRRDLALDTWIVDATKRILELHQERKAINQQVQAIIEDAEVRGLARKTFKKKVKEYEMDESKRLAEEATARRMDRAYGWKHEQLEFFPQGPAAETPLDLTPDRSDAIMDHIAKHGTKPIGDTLDQQDAAETGGKGSRRKH